ncbi:MAG: hypothetical protein M3R08_07625, partial [Bacteroidota bacterium]|nr:hypothetical protein [Bacteroidota bacterium]
SGAPVVYAGNDASVCINNPITALNGSVTNGFTTGEWTTTGDGEFTNAFALNTIYEPGPNDLTNGSVTVTLTSTNNDDCIAVSDEKVITFGNGPVVVAGDDRTICANTVIQLGGSVSGSTNTGMWSTSGSGDFLPSNTAFDAVYHPSAADTTAGSVILTLISTNNGGCNVEEDQLILTFTPAPLVIAGNDIVICLNYPIAILDGSIGAGSTSGAWSTNGSGSFDPSPSAMNATYSASPEDISSGGVILTLTSSVEGTCLAENDQLALSFSGAPVVNAGADASVCINNPEVALVGSVSVGATTGTWTTAGDGTFQYANALNTSYDPGPTDLINGSVLLTLTSSNSNNCISVSDDKLVTFGNGPVVLAGSDQTMCANNVVQLNGSVSGSTNTGAWSTSGSGSFLPSADVLDAIYQPSTADTTSGSVILTLVSTNNGGCNVESDALNVMFTPAPLVSAGADLTQCANNAIASLNGSISAGATLGTWSTTGSGSFVPNAETLDASYVPTAEDLLDGVTITLTSTDHGNCVAVADDLVITYIDEPSVAAGADQFVCLENNVQLNGAVQNGSGTGIWTSSGTGSFSPDATSLNANYVPSTADFTNGNVELTLTSTNNGNCTAVSDLLQVSFTAPPTVSVGDDQSTCDNVAVALGGNVSGSTITGIWNTTGDGAFIPSNTAVNASYQPGPSDAAAGNIILTLQATNACPMQDQLVITVIAGPSAQAGSDQTICTGTTSVPLAGEVGGTATLGEWSSLNDGNFSPSINDLNASYELGAAELSSGEAFLILTTLDNGVCAASSDTLRVSINSIPLISAGADTTVCATAYVALNGSISDEGAVLWTSDGTGSFIPSADVVVAEYHFSAQDIAVGAVNLTLNATEACVPVTEDLQVSIIPSPVVNAGSDQAICAGVDIDLNGTVTSETGTGIWSTNGNGSFAFDNTQLQNGYQPTTDDIANGNLSFTLISTG